MTVIRAQVNLEHDNALPEDRVVNTWHFAIPGDPTAVEMDAIQTALVNFYTVVPAGSTATVASLLSSTLSGKWSIRQYNLGEPEPRVPIRVFEPADFAPGPDTLPREVACCLSFRAAVASGENAARRRGRVFIGPLRAGATVIDTDGRPTLAA